MLRSVAADNALRLEAVKVENDLPYFLFPTQTNLKADLWASFNGFDELNFGVSDFFSATLIVERFSIEDFRDRIEGIVTGRYRIRQRFYTSKLEAPVDGSWKTLATYSSGRWYGWTPTIFQQTTKSL